MLSDDIVIFIYYIPSILPLISATLMWQGILMEDGVLNAVLAPLGIDPINWLGYDKIVCSLVFLMLNLFLKNSSSTERLPY